MSTFIRDISKVIKKEDEQLLDEISSLYGDKISNTNDLTGGEKPTLLFYFLARHLRYLLDDEPELTLSKEGIEFRRKINVLLKKVGKYFLKNPQIFENRQELINPGCEKNDTEIQLPKEPVIWMANHAFKDDTLATILAAKRHAYILFGSLPQFYNTFDGVTAYLNGVAMTNRKVKSSRHSSIDKAKYLIGNGADLMMFPEGVWNKTSESLIIHLWPGIYRTSQETGAKVVPIVHYLRDMAKPGKDNPIHTVVDDPIDITNMSEKQALSYLRDVMATWVYLMMEKYGKSTRDECFNGSSSYDEIWERELIKRVATTGRYDTEIEYCADYRPRDIINPEDVWKDIAELPLSKDNMDSVIYAKKLVLERNKRNFQHRF